MTCPACGLPDDYRGEGDGIGSCECSRCDCCGRGPDDCECRRDWNDYDHAEDLDDEFDPFCNDTSCSWRRARLDRKAAHDA